MTTLKYLVRTATIPGKSSSSAIDNPHPTEVAAGRKSMLGRRSLGRRSRNMMRQNFLRLLGVFSLCPADMTADVHAQPADPKRSLLRAPLEFGGVWTSSPPDAVALEKLVRFALFLYATQAAIGFSVGLVLPWLFYFGVIDR